MIMLEMSLPNRAGILTPVDGLEEGNSNYASYACYA
jgi:DNA polymerase-3 subunit beta